MIDTALKYVPLKTGASTRVASDSTDFLAVWTDTRGLGQDIYATRVRGTGEIADTTPVLVCTDSLAQSDPDVAFGAGLYMVAWADGRGGIYCARVTPGGSVLDQNGFHVGGRSSEGPAVSFSGADFLIVWSEDFYDTSYNQDIWGVRVTSQGQVLDSLPIRISTAPRPQWLPRLVYGRNSYLVAWEDNRVAGSYWIYGCRVLQNGTVLDSAGIPIDTANYDHWEPDVASGDTSFYVVWRGNPRGGNLDDVYGTRINRGGVVLDPGGIRISYQNFIDFPAIVCSQGNYLVCWTDYGSSFVLEGCVSPDGRLADTVPRFLFPALFSYSNRSALSRAQAVCILTVCNTVSGGAIAEARLDFSGTPVDSALVSLAWGANPQIAPAVASRGSDYLVAWQDGRGNDQDIYGARVSETGAVLDVPAIPISTAARDQSAPSAASDGTTYVVVWSDGRDTSSTSIYAARITAGGQVLDPDGVRISSNGENPKVAFDGANYFVAWDDGVRIRAARITTGGFLLDSVPITVTGHWEYNRNVSLAVGDSNLLVVYDNERNAQPPPYAAFGKRVDRTGRVIDSDDIQFGQSRFWSPLLPSAVFDGNDYFVMWGSGSGARLTQSGQIIDTNGLSYPGVGEHPSMVCSGPECLLAWRSGNDVSGARVTLSGQELDMYVMVSQAGPAAAPCLGLNDHRRPLLGYAGWTETAVGRDYYSTRVWGKLGPFGGIAEEYSHATTPSLQLSACPNPFRDRVRFQLTASSLRTRLRIYDISGQLVRNVDIPHSAFPTPHSLTWEGTDALGRKLPSGIYLARLETGDGTTVTKQVLLLR